MAKFVPNFDFAEAIGQKELEVEAYTVNELLEYLKKNFPDAYHKHVKNITILVNGRNINYTGGVKTGLSNEDGVWFMLPGVGG